MDLIMAENIECFMGLHQNPLTLCNLPNTFIQIDLDLHSTKKLIHNLLTPSL